MDQKRWGLVLLVVGIVLVLVSAGADMVGLGGAVGFGYKQIVGAVVGVIAAAAGFALYRR